MAISHARSKRKASGGRYHKLRDKRKYELGRFPASTRLGEKKTKEERTRGGNVKRKALLLEEVNVVDLKSKKAKKAKILTVEENKANRHYVRRQIITKGAVVKTDMGNVKITNRPGQEGFVSGVLMKKE